MPLRNLTSEIIITSYPFACGGQADLYEADIQNKKGYLLPNQAQHATQSVVLKVIRITRNDNAELTKLQDMFEKTMAGWSNLSHPNVAQILGYTTHPLLGQGVAQTPEYPLLGPGLAMPRYCNALDYLKENSDTDTKLSLILGAAEGLKYLHLKSVVHTSIKAKNILVNEKGEPLLTDIGLVPFIRTFADHYEGNHRWLAPEVITKKDKGYSPKSDIYSFAMLMVEAITLTHPFPDLKLGATVMLQVMTGARPSKPDDSPVTEHLWLLMERCWKENPEERPDMRDVCEWISAKREHGGIHGV